MNRWHAFDLLTSAPAQWCAHVKTYIPHLLKTCSYHSSMSSHSWFLVTHHTLTSHFIGSIHDILSICPKIIDLFRRIISQCSIPLNLNASPSILCTHILLHDCHLPKIPIFLMYSAHDIPSKYSKSDLIAHSLRDVLDTRTCSSLCSKKGGTPQCVHDISHSWCKQKVPWNG